MKAIVFLADGFEECEALIVVDILRRASVETVMASVMGRPEVESSRSIVVKADTLVEDVDFSSVDLIVLPGGRLGIENLGESPIVKEQCKEFAANKRLAAICAAPSLPAALGLLEGRRATCHPDFEGQMPGAIVTRESVVMDGNIITGQGLGASFDFAFVLAGLLAGCAKVEQIKEAICYNAFEDQRAGYCCE